MIRAACTSTSAVIRDIPALVNEELAKYFPDDDRVMALPGLNHAEVHQVTESSLQAGADLLDLQIPLFSLTLQAARNAIAIARGHTDWRTSLENIGIDSFGTDGLEARPALSLRPRPSAS